MNNIGLEVLLTRPCDISFVEMGERKEYGECGFVGDMPCWVPVCCYEEDEDLQSG